MDTIRAFFPKSVHFLQFSKKGIGGSPCPTLVASVSVANFASSSLNILEHRSDYARALNNASGSKGAKVLNMTRLYMPGLHRVLNMSEYGSVYLNNS